VVAMRYEVFIKSGAERQLKKLPGQYRKIITEAILGLADNPRPFGVKKMSGMENHFRIRVGDYRIIYTIQDKKLVVVVIRIGARKEVYR